METIEKHTIEILDTTLKHGFSQIPRTVLKAKNLSMQSKTLYALLLDYAWQKDQCFPGQDRLATDLGVHRNTIQKYLIELRTFKLIKWVRRGLKQTNIYYILPINHLIQNLPDAQARVHQDSQDNVHTVAQTTVHKLEEDEYKKKEYKKPLSLSNANEQLNLNTFDTEALVIAKELNDEKSIKFYQKIVNQKKKGEIADEDIVSALDDTRRMVRTDQVDGKRFLRNPASWFVSTLQKLTQKRKEKEQKVKVESMLEKFHKSFTLRIIVFITSFLLVGFNINIPVYASENIDITIDSVFEAHNQIRKENSLPEFILNEELTKSAYLKAVTMKFQKCWSHYCPDSPWGDFSVVGYEYEIAGENLAHGFTDPDVLIKAWLDSPTHKANIMNDKYSEIGIAVIDSSFLDDSTDKIVVVHFAKPKLNPLNNDFLAFQNKIILGNKLCWRNY